MNAFYREVADEHRWQGDIFSANTLGSVTEQFGGVPYWMVMNRTCHMVEGQGRSPKLPYLVFCPVVPLEAQIVRDKVNGNEPPKLYNQVGNIINGKSESLAFLPGSLEHGLTEHHVVDFSAPVTVDIDECALATEKLVQLSSPFSEHLSQRFSRFYSTFGYDDSTIKDKAYIESVAGDLELRFSTLVPIDVSEHQT